MAKTILIATGGRPFIPHFEGSEHVVTSNEMFDLKELPKRLVIVGGGYIASEFACIMNGLGSEVHQFYRGAQILRGFDGEVRGHVADEMIARERHVPKALPKQRAPHTLLIHQSAKPFFSLYI